MAGMSGWPKTSWRSRFNPRHAFPSHSRRRFGNPDEISQKHYRGLQKKEKDFYSDLNKIKEAPTITLDKIPVELHANIELPQDFEIVQEAGAKGVGLYRTEFLYMNRETPPDEQEHYETYSKVIKILDGLPLTIRTLDLGADKQVDGGRAAGPVMSNPALGLRASGASKCFWIHPKQRASSYPSVSSIAH